jgi:hypothetical protein
VSGLSLPPEAIIYSLWAVKASAYAMAFAAALLAARGLAYAARGYPVNPMCAAATLSVAVAGAAAVLAAPGSLLHCAAGIAAALYVSSLKLLLLIRQKRLEARVKPILSL